MELLHAMQAAWLHNNGKDTDEARAKQLPKTAPPPAEDQTMLYAVCSCQMPDSIMPMHNANAGHTKHACVAKHSARKAPTNWKPQQLSTRTHRLEPPTTLGVGVHVVASRQSMLQANAQALSHGCR